MNSAQIEKAIGVPAGDPSFNLIVEEDIAKVRDWLVLQGINREKE